MTRSGTSTPDVRSVWINDELVDVALASVCAFDHGLLTGDGVFETLRIYRGQPFALRRHLTRLARSAAGLRLPLPAPEVLTDALTQVIEAGELAEGRRGSP